MKLKLDYFSDLDKYYCGMMPLKFENISKLLTSNLTRKNLEKRIQLTKYHKLNSFTHHALGPLEKPVTWCYVIQLGKRYRRETCLVYILQIFRGLVLIAKFTSLSLAPGIYSIQKILSRRYFVISCSFEDLPLTTSSTHFKNEKMWLNCRTRNWIDIVYQTVDCD